MSTSSSQTGSDSSTDNSRQQATRYLGREISSLRFSEKKGDGKWAPVLTLTPTGDWIGRATVAGVAMEVEENSGSSVTLKLLSGDSHTMRAYANTNSGASPGEVKSIETPQPVVCILRTDIYDAGERVYASPNIEEIRTVDMDDVWAYRAEAASKTLQRVNALESNLEDGDPDAMMADAHYSGDAYAQTASPADLREHAKSVLQRAQEAVLEDESDDEDPSGDVPDEEEAVVDEDIQEDIEEADGEAEDDGDEDADESSLRETLKEESIYPPAIQTLCEEFDSMNELQDADESELKSIEQVGRQTASDIQEL